MRWYGQCYRALERLADAMSRIHIGLFAFLAVVHTNYWVTRIVHHLFVCVLHGLLMLHAPKFWVDQVRQYTSWSREWSFTKPSDWLVAYARAHYFHDRVDVVVAHYKEDLSWLKPYLGKINHLYLYCKNSETCLKGMPQDLQGAQLVVTHLPNEGREAHTYLHHMITHYDQLSDRTVFTLASLNGNWMRKLSFIFALTESSSPKRYCYKSNVFEQLRAFQFSSSTAVATSLGDGYDNKVTGKPIKFSPYRPLNVWMQHYLKEDVFQSRCRFGDGQHGAIFSVKREEIHQYKKDFYQVLLEANSGADSMEAGYFMERLWRFMFSMYQYKQQIIDEEEVH